jgi:subtilase family protein
MPSRSPRPSTRGLWAVGLLTLALPLGLAAQRPTVSPPLAAALARDSSFTVWIFVRRDISLPDAARRAASLGATIRTTSRWLHAVSALAPSAVLVRLTRERWLRRLQPLGRWRRQPSPRVDEAVAAAVDTCPAAGDPFYGPSEMPYRQLGLRRLADAGVTGTGVRIAILDAGFNTLDPAFSGVTVTAQRDFVFDDSIVRDEANDQPGAQSHGTAVWSLFAGLVPGRLVGVARGASYLLAKTEDIRSETRVEEDHYVAALEWADSIGVDIVSSSLGYLVFDNGFGYTPSQLNGDVAVTTVAADSATARGILVVTAAGNNGPGFRTLVTPGDADSVITVGAEDSLGAVTAFSSRGPTADGRLKPDLTAPGSDVCAIAGTSLGRLAGTSFATPLIAAASALVQQLHPSIGPVALRAVLRAQGTNRDAPDSIRGWGRPDVGAAAVFAAGITPLAPLPPTLISITPEFTWTVGSIIPSEAPVSYRLRVAHDSTLAAPFVDTTLALEQYSLRRPLQPGYRLFWQVDATSATGLTASTGPVGPIAVPAWVRLTALADSSGSATSEVRPRFTWSPVGIATPPGPFRYDLTVRNSGSTEAFYSIAGLTDTSFVLPTPLEHNATYRWQLMVHAGSDSSLVISPASFVVLDSAAPPATLLYQNFPNPFPTATRSTTCIWFDLAQPGSVTLEVLNLRGGVVRRLLPGSDFPDILPAGRYGRGGPGGPLCDPRLSWDGRADDGQWLPAGVYLYKLKFSGLIQFKRIVYRGRAP